MKLKMFFFASTCIAVVFAIALPTYAGSRTPYRADVTACSRYANGCYTAAVIPGHHGRHLVLHNGTRIDCDGDCENTLRETTVDFWDTMRENGG